MVINLTRELSDELGTDANHTLKPRKVIRGKNGAVTSCPAENVFTFPDFQLLFHYRLATLRASMETVYKGRQSRRPAQLPFEEDFPDITITHHR